MKSTILMVLISAIIPGLRQDSEAERVFVRSLNPNPVVEDYPGYACSGRATCSESMHSICMSSC